MQTLQPERTPVAPRTLGWTRGWWMVIARGVVAVLLGTGALFWRMDSTRLGTFFGVGAFGIGVLAILAGLAAPFAGRRLRAPLPDIGWPLVCEGIVGVALGAIAIAAAVSPLGLALVVAAWAAVTGLLEIATAIQLHRVLAGERLLVAAGVGSLVAAVLMLVRGVTLLPWILGVYAVFLGAMLFVAGMRLRHLDLGEPEEA